MHGRVWLFNSTTTHAHTHPHQYPASHLAKYMSAVHSLIHLHLRARRHTHTHSLSLYGAGFDFITTAGTRFTGRSTPNGVRLEQGDTITWSTDFSVTFSGFTVRQSSVFRFPFVWSLCCHVVTVSMQEQTTVSQSCMHSMKNPMACR